MTNNTARDDRYRRTGMSNSALERRRKAAERIIKKLLEAGNDAETFARTRSLPSSHKDFWRGYNTALRAVATALSRRPDLFETMPRPDAPPDGQPFHPDTIVRFHALPPRFRRAVLTSAARPECTARDLAEQLGVAATTAAWYIAQARRRLGLKHKDDLRRFALHYNLIQPETQP